MRIGLLSVLLVSITSIAIFVYTLFKHKTKVYALKLFLLIIVFFNAWAICGYLIYHNDGNTAVGSIANGLAFTSGFLAIYLAFLFSFAYPLKSRFIKNKRAITNLSIVAVLFSAVSALPFIAGKVLVDENNKVSVTDPPLEILYILAAFTLLALLSIRYIRVIRLTKGAERAQAYLIFLAIVTSIIAAVATSIVLPLFGYDVTYQVFVPPVVMMLTGLVIFMITRRGLFDIRPIIARSLTNILAVATLLGLFTIVTLLALAYLFNLHINVRETLFFALLSVVLAIAYQPIKKLYESFASKFLYYDGYNPQKFLNSINETLVDSDDLQAQLAMATQNIKSTLKVSFASIYVNADKQSDVTRNGTDTALLQTTMWKTLKSYLENDTQKVFISTHSQEETNISRCMKQIKTEVVLKLLSHNEVVGYLLVGFRRSRNSLTTADIQVLEIVADELAIAVQNSLRLSQISHFNATLQSEINSATLELQKSNQKLLQLDKAKDEFISMASHQLRTPLTSIKGYISIILDGDTGDITKQQKAFLTQAFISSQHMAYVIGDLLNLSRIKTGTFVLERKPLLLQNMVENEINVMQAIAKSKDILLVYKVSGTIPKVLLDDTKTRQVVMNFIDNAIHYTPKGGLVTVTLTASNKHIEFMVKDTGIGVPKSEQSHLFSKFYRASNARQVRPDGTGIGIYMAKKVILAQGGSIIFKATEGKGSTFGFRFAIDKISIVD